MIKFVFKSKMAYCLTKEKEGITNYVGKLIDLLGLVLNQLTHLRMKIKKSHSFHHIQILSNNVYRYVSKWV